MYDSVKYQQCFKPLGMSLNLLIDIMIHITDSYCNYTNQ